MSDPRMIPKIEDLHNESDVEQKLLYTLLTLPEPHGFGFSSASIRTKANIRRFKIGKGKEEKLYYPDYLIVISGLPMLVVEAKAPGEDLQEAYRQARLYATELNSAFSTRMNPASKLICSNGLALIAGSWDSDKPNFSLVLDNLHSADPDFASLLDFAAIDRLTKESQALLDRITRRPFFKPTRLLGGLSVRNEEVGHNSFGASIALEYRHLFNPSSREERAYIVKNAYISSKRRERYIEPIDRFIRAAASPSESDAKMIADTESPVEVIQKLRRHSSIERQILLLVGGVGVGKSTFVDYLREVALPADVLISTVWVHINMNNAPLSADLIYDWLCDQLSSQIRHIHSNTDFDDIHIITKVYATELNRLKKGALKLLKDGSDEYNSKLADVILQLQQDKNATTKALTRYCCGERGKLLIVILDNCDKRLRDEQLLMFQAAQWLRQEFPCLVILPLRDETYDNHRTEPPLDTALKDLVFRIEPPSFSKVLGRRVSLTLKEMQERSGARVLSYVLPNNFKVEYPAENQAYYLTAILKSIFEYDKFLRRMMVGLAGRDLRRAMEIFLEFCMSGHFGEDEIFKITQAEGNYTIPYHIVARVLLRMNRRFYSGDHSYVTNLFDCRYEDPKPNYFVRLSILRWLDNHFRVEGPAGIRGYHQVTTLKTDLFPLGMSEEIVQRELLYLLKARCILAEHLRTDRLADEDLIRLSPAGSVHLELAKYNLDYLAAVAEDVWFDDQTSADAIAERISHHKHHYNANTTVRNAETLVNYLKKKLREPFPAPDIYLEDSSWRYLVDIGDAERNVAKAASKIQSSDPWFKIAERYHVGQIVPGIIQNLTVHGVFIDIAGDITGLIPASSMDSELRGRLRRKAKVNVKIKEIHESRKRMILEFVDEINT